MGTSSQAYPNQFIKANSALNPDSPLTQDGRVDPVVGGKITGALTGHVYTILALNNSYKNARRNAALLDITADAAVSCRTAPINQDHFLMRTSRLWLAEIRCGSLKSDVAR